MVTAHTLQQKRLKRLKLRFSLMHLQLQDCERRAPIYHPSYTLGHTRLAPHLAAESVEAVEAQVLVDVVLGRLRLLHPEAVGLAEARRSRLEEGAQPVCVCSCGCVSCMCVCPSVCTVVFSQPA